MNQINSIMATPTTAGTLVTSGKYAGYTKQEVAGSPGTVIYRAAGSPMIRPQVQTTPSNKDIKKESSGSGVIISEKMTITDYPDSSSKRTRTINVPQPSVVEVPGQPSTVTIKSGPHKGETISIPGKSTTIVSTGAWESPASEGIKQRMLNQQQTTEQQVATGSVSTIGGNVSGVLGSYGSNIPQEFLISSQQKTEGSGMSYTPKPSPRSTGSGSGGRSRSQSTGGYPGSPGLPMTPAYPGAEPTSPAVITSPTITIGGRGGVTVPVSDLSIRNVAVGQVDRYGRQTVVSKTDFIKTDFINTQEVLRQSLANPKEALERAGLIISPSSSQQSIQTRSQAPDYEFQIQSQFKAQAIEQRFYSRGLTVAYAEGTTYAGLKEITTGKAEITFKEKAIGDMGRSLDRAFFSGAKAEQTALLNQIRYEAKGTTISGYTAKIIEPGASLTGSFMKTGISSVSSNIPEYILKRELGTSTTMDYSPKISSGTKKQTIPSLRLNEYDLLKAETKSSTITEKDYTAAIFNTAIGSTAAVVIGATALGEFAVANIGAIGKTVTGKDIVALPKLYMGIGAGMYYMTSSVYSELKEPKLSPGKQIATVYVEGASLLTFGKLLGVSGKVASKSVDFAGTRFPIVKSLQLRFISKEARIAKATEEAQAMFKRTKESPFAAVETKYGVKIRTVARETGGIPNIIADTVKKPSFSVRAEQWWRSKTGKTPEQYTLKEMGIKPRGKIESFLNPTKLTIEQELGRMIEAKTGQSRLTNLNLEYPKLTIEQELGRMIEAKSGQSRLTNLNLKYPKLTPLEKELAFMIELRGGIGQKSLQQIPMDWISLDTARITSGGEIAYTNIAGALGIQTFQIGKKLYAYDRFGSLIKVMDIDKMYKNTLQRIGSESGGLNFEQQSRLFTEQTFKEQIFKEPKPSIFEEPASRIKREVPKIERFEEPAMRITRDFSKSERVKMQEPTIFKEKSFLTRSLEAMKTSLRTKVSTGGVLASLSSISLRSLVNTNVAIGQRISTGQLITPISGDITDQKLKEGTVQIQETGQKTLQATQLGQQQKQININDVMFGAAAVGGFSVFKFFNNIGGFKETSPPSKIDTSFKETPFPSGGADIGSAEFGGFGGRGFGGELGRMKTQYTPSITAIGLGIYGKVTSKVTTGLELRPLPGKKSKMERLI